MSGVSCTWVSVVLVATYVHTLHHHEPLELIEAEPEKANKYVWFSSTPVFSGIPSTVIALSLSDAWVSLAGYRYFLLLPLFLVKRFKRLS